MIRQNADFYERYIASVEWSLKRAERLAVDQNQCQACLHDGSEWRLEIHHKTYERLGHEDVGRDLITLCCQCHEAVTNVIRSRRYAGRPACVEFVRVVHATRKDACHGMEDCSVSYHRGCSADHAQWNARKPAESGGKDAQADHRQAEKDRRGP
jgi:hypothetical protein